MKILGMGNALVDVLIRLNDDNVLNELELPKGSMQLIDQHKREKIFRTVDGYNTSLATGGSASNTILALSKMGVDSGFIGKVGDDEYGRFYVREIGEAGVTPHFYRENSPSGTAMTLITPDGERTFGTYLGAAADLQANELQENVFLAYRIFYVEGYLINNYSLIEKAMQMAKAQGLMIAIDLASYNVVEANRDSFLTLIREYVDIVFANKEEARMLTGKESEEAVKELASMTRIAVVKVGSDGSFVMKGEDLVKIPAIETQMVDATAAGDFFAAGFFYGMIHQAGLEQCGRIGSLLASNVIKVVGTKLSEEVWDKIRLGASEILN
ncbi:MAG: adenosine kinase [Dysgonamonadaceae bacterium]|jgi:sugar/nucleoside kinase (ribokinase family)|nr:adenosine kinase [Dysgonamonadaceae bacterium]